MANLSVGHFVIIGFVLSLCHDCRRWCWWAWWLQKAFKDNDNDNDNDNIRFDKTHFYTTTVNNWHKWQMGQSKNQKRHVTTTIGQRQQNILTSTQICSKFLKNNIFCHLGLSKKPSWSKPLRSEYLKAVFDKTLSFAVGYPADQLALGQFKAEQFHWRFIFASLLFSSLLFSSLLFSSLLFSSLLFSSLLFSSLLFSSLLFSSLLFSSLLFSSLLFSSLLFSSLLFSSLLFSSLLFSSLLFSSLLFSSLLFSSLLFSSLLFSSLLFSSLLFSSLLFSSLLYYFFFRFYLLFHLFFFYFFLSSLFLSFSHGVKGWKKGHLTCIHRLQYIVRHFVFLPFFSCGGGCQSQTL